MILNDLTIPAGLELCSTGDLIEQAVRRLPPDRIRSNRSLPEPGALWRCLPPENLASLDCSRQTAHAFDIWISTSKICSSQEGAKIAQESGGNLLVWRALIFFGGLGNVIGVYNELPELSVVSAPVWVVGLIGLIVNQRKGKA